MKNHNIHTGHVDTTHGNKISWPHKPDSERWPLMEIRKVPADSVPYGSSITRNGRTVWAAYHDGVLAAVGATKDEARSKYKDVQRREAQRLRETDAG